MTPPGDRDESGLHAPSLRHAGAVSGTPRVVTSDTLLRGDPQLAILHEQTLYFLRKTRFGKLILTK